MNVWTKFYSCPLNHRFRSDISLRTANLNLTVVIEEKSGAFIISTINTCTKLVPIYLAIGHISGGFRLSENLQLLMVQE